MWFSSDNAGPVAPEVMAALAAANAGYAASYGADPLMARVTAKIREAFEAPEAAVYLVSTGTTANALSLAMLCPPWATVFCHRNAHIEEDECAAPEFYTGGAKLTLLDGKDAKIAPESLARALSFTGRGGVHNVQKGALSLTNATENGAIYTPAEVAELAGMAHAEGVPVHMDGARFANALVRLGCTPAELTWKAGVDILSFGGTKNGLMGVEAVVMFDPKKAWEFELRRKRGGHLFSKHRYLSAQMDAYLTDGLWLRLAASANAAADRLAEGLRARQARLLHPVQANAIFTAFPRASHKRAQQAGAHYYFWPFNQSLEGPDDEMLSCRMVCNWSTTAEDVDALLAAL
ncbi:low specificity L-threonine aldolase [Paroceanicella profunda]|uniref:L-threonine aldolase n=1 Tax=Paroceanicella profunda TaxID=2579971 RepID=A0A5B8FY66_9RHOB|nr:beta-eliminating lyase-related protein [Paroceanicella profunda]QDL92270.1 low specificity L-threonine aldolase [Paroceanicella profunda]